VYQEFVDKIQRRLEKALLEFKEDINVLQTGRATPALLEELEVEAYNTKMPLNQLAAIQSPDPRTLFVQPWDKTIIKNVEKAIINSPLKFSPVLDGEILRISIPPLNEEKRKELIKILGEKTEKARIRVRQAREEVLNEVKKREQAGEITKDDKFLSKDKIQEKVNQANKKIEEISRQKEGNILNI